MYLISLLLISLLNTFTITIKTLTMARPYFRRIKCTLVRLQFCCKTIAEYNIVRTIRTKVSNIEILLNMINNTNNNDIESYYSLYINCNKIYKAINYIHDEQIKQSLYKLINELTLNLI